MATENWCIAGRALAGMVAPVASTGRSLGQPKGLLEETECKWLNPLAAVAAPVPPAPPARACPAPGDRTRSLGRDLRWNAS
jgi:hypothetical protein